MEIYVSNLPSRATTNQMMKLFSKYGDILKIDLRRPARGCVQPFCLIKFKDSRDAEDAVQDRDGFMLDGKRIKVLVSRRQGHSCGGVDGGRMDVSRYEVYVTGLPKGTCWQDLKGHMRNEVGDVVRVNISKDGVSGRVQFAHSRDADKALKTLNNTRFRGRGEDVTLIKLNRVNNDLPEKYGATRDGHRSKRPIRRRQCQTTEVSSNSCSSNSRRERETKRQGCSPLSGTSYSRRCSRSPVHLHTQVRVFQ